MILPNSLREGRGRAVSRVLFSPEGERRPFGWGACRHASQTADPVLKRRGPRLGPYLAFLPAGFAVRRPSPAARCALTAPFHPCRPAEAGLGGIFSVALSLGSPPVGVTHRRALWSPDFPPSAQAEGGRPPAPYIIIANTLCVFTGLPKKRRHKHKFSYKTREFEPVLPR